MLFFNKHNRQAAHHNDAPFRIFNMGNSAPKQSGSIIFYIFMAIGLLMAMTLSLMNSSPDQARAERARQIVNILEEQGTYIKAAIMECVLTYPDGGGDLNGDGAIDTSDNVQAPYPLFPFDNNNPATPTVSSGYRYIDELQCPGAPATDSFIFDDNKYLVPDPPQPLGDWNYFTAGSSGSDQVAIYATCDPADDLCVTIGDIFAAGRSNCEVQVFNSGTELRLTYRIQKENC